MNILIQAAKAQELTTHPRSRPAPSGPVVVAFFMLGVWAMGHDVWSAIPGTPNNHFFEWMFGEFQPFPIYKDLESSN